MTVKQLYTSAGSNIQKQGVQRSINSLTALLEGWKQSEPSSGALTARMKSQEGEYQLQVGLRFHELLVTIHHGYVESPFYETSPKIFQAVRCVLIQHA
jgi:hypothetical protein